MNPKKPVHSTIFISGKLRQSGKTAAYEKVKLLFDLEDTCNETRIKNLIWFCIMRISVEFFQMTDLQQVYDSMRTYTSAANAEGTISLFAGMLGDFKKMDSHIKKEAYNLWYRTTSREKIKVAESIKIVYTEIEIRRNFPYLL